MPLGVHTEDGAHILILPIMSLPPKSLPLPIHYPCQ